MKDDLKMIQLMLVTIWIYITDALIILKLSQVSRLPLTAVMAIYHTEVSPVLLNQVEASNPKEVALSNRCIYHTHGYIIQTILPLEAAW